MQFLFSLASKDDAKAIFTLYRSMIGTPHNTWNEHYPTMNLVLEDIQLQALYVLKDSHGSIIATATAGSEMELDDLSWDLHNPCELARVAVSVPLQNQGIGTYLLQQIIPAIKERGFDGICMLVSKHHSHAIALYEKNGFTCCGEVSRYDLDFYMYQMVFK